MLRTACLSLFLFLSLFQTGWAQNDRIRFRDANEKDARCDIIDMTWRKVSFYLVAGGQQIRQDRATKEIRDIIFGDGSKPYDYKSAENLMNNGRYEDAISKFEKARRNPRCSSALKQTAGRNIAICCYYAGDYDRAISFAQQFRKENPNTYYLAETYQLEYDAHQAKSPPDLRKMSRTVEDFTRAANSKNSEWKKPAGIMRAGLLEFQKKWSEALGIYGNGSYQSDIVVGTQAKLGELRVLSILQKWSPLKSKAKAILRDAKKKTLEETLLMGAHVAQGDVELSSGNTKEAIYSYLRAALQLHTSGDPSREHETALGRASIACSRYATSLKDPEKKAEYQSIAGQLIGELGRSYPGSPLLSRAQEELGKIR